MGIFDFPRINVWGKVLVNPGTGNNDSAIPGVELTVTSNSQRVQPAVSGVSDQDFRTWMCGLDASQSVRAQWNYFGDMSYEFQDVSVQSVVLGDGKELTSASQDPLVGSKVALLDAILCDNNPEGFDSTQMFSMALSIDAPGAFQGGAFLSRKPCVATTRWLNWFRNVSFHGTASPSSGGAGGASAAFQHSIVVKPQDLSAEAGLGSEYQWTKHKLLPTSDSPGAQALVSVLKNSPGAQGLVFRYSMYLTYPLISDPDLAAMFAQGSFVPNPAYGQIVGTIAPWLAGEPETITMGRYLKSANTYPNPYRKGQPRSDYKLSPITAVVDGPGNRVRVDTVNSLPEDGPFGDKYDLGQVRIGVRAATPTGTDPTKNTAPVTDVGTIGNTRADYLRTGGIYDLDIQHLTPQQRGWLSDDAHELVLTSDGTVLLYEDEYMVMSDIGCTYLDELAPGGSWDEVHAGIDEAVRAHTAKEPGAPPVPRALRGKLPLHIRRRGQVPPSVTVTVEEWRMTPTGNPEQPFAYKYPVKLGESAISLVNGIATYSLKPTGGAGARLYRFVLPGEFQASKDGPTLAWTLFEEFFAMLRLLPYDDYSTSDGTWDELYDEVLRYYHLIFPGMSARLDLGDPSIWTDTTARYLLRVTDPAEWETWLYMPRTRDLSAARRDLLRTFCRWVIDNPGKPIPRRES